MTGKSILIEGFEATGKSTLAQRLSEHFNGARLIHMPKGVTTLSQSVYELIKQTDREDVRRALLLASHIENHTEIQQLKDSGQDLILDRGLLSFFAYQHYDGLHLDEEVWDSVLFAFDMPIVEHDYVFLLSASERKIRERLESRGKEKLDEAYLSRLNQIQEGFEAGKENIYPDAIEIDTSFLSLEQTFEIVLEHIEGD